MVCLEERQVLRSWYCQSLRCQRACGGRDKVLTCQAVQGKEGYWKRLMPEVGRESSGKCWRLDGAWQSLWCWSVLAPSLPPFSCPAASFPPSFPLIFPPFSCLPSHSAPLLQGLQDLGSSEGGEVFETQVSVFVARENGERRSHN